jgi:hypothetical protein
MWARSIGTVKVRPFWSSTSTAPSNAIGSSYCEIW